MSRYSILLKCDSKNPLIGHKHRPNTSARLMNATIQINSDGLRDQEYPTGKSDKYRIIFLGDSITLGWGVEREESFEYIHEKQLNKDYPTEIVNFGTGNYNTEQEVNLFLEKGLKYKPDEIVVFYFINDAEITPKKSKWWFLGYSRLMTFYWSRMHACFNKLFPSRSYSKYYSDLYKKDQKGWINAKMAFLQLRNICRNNNITLKVILVPELHKLDDYPFKEEHAKIAAFLEKNNIACFDLALLFVNCNNPMELWNAPDDAHPNEKAHRLIAEYSLPFISEKK